MTWRLRTRRLPADRPAVAGIVNVTPDSFSDGGAFLSLERAVEHARALTAAGADLIDVGGESTRPFAEPVPEEEELRRVAPVVEELCRLGMAVSVDTSKPGVAEAALAAGAEAINDVTGLADPAMRRLAAAAGCGVVVMHMQGSPRTMQVDPHYGDVVEEVAGFLGERCRLAEDAGVGPEAICVDPGIGFGKTLDHNLDLLAGLDRIARLGHPVMVGVSRKGFLGRLLGIDDPAKRGDATAVAEALAVAQGATVLRTHDVRRAIEAATLARAIVRRRVHRA